MSIWQTACFVFGGMALALPAVAGQGAEVTFARDIAPILQRSCENCHRTGGVAPFPLTTHDEVRPWARAVKNKTMTREMPPWFIERNVGLRQFAELEVKRLVCRGQAVLG